MINKIKKINLESLFDFFQQDSMRLDVILCHDDTCFVDVQHLLEEEDRFTLVALEEQDLHNQRTILEGLHQVFFDELPDKNEEVLEIIEAIEDELREDESCLLVVNDFSSCSKSTQAALLELTIVSRAFKLFLKITHDIDFSDNEHLWNVLAERSVMLEQDEHANDMIEEDESEDLNQYDDAVDNNYEENSYDENSYDDNGFEEKTDRENAYQESDDEAYESELIPTPNKTHVKKTAWYQLLPKYHLAAIMLLIIVIVLLWNMDVTQQKQELVDLPLPSQEIIENTTVETSQKTDVTIDNNVIEIQKIETQNENENNVSAVKDQFNKNPSETPLVTPIETPTEMPSADEEIANNNQAAIKIEKSISVEKPSITTTSKVVSQPASNSVAIKKIDWSPYQSDAWIKGLNSKYYTLQLMASHDDQGIRNFLQERGVSSQYAVYSSEKNSKPWHVIIYGVYENREFADLARKELPSYLKDYSPWVRNIGEVQNTLK